MNDESHRSRHSIPGRGRGRTNLPVELTSFVGRRHEVAEAKKMLSGSRLVTLTGIGGVGKTRLALRVATESQRAFTDGVWLIELSELSDPELVTGVVSDVLGLRNQTVEAPLVLLTDYLADKDVLLVLDNCEHLLEAVAALADTVLRTCPGVRILATSREPLRVRGEAVTRVPPMQTPNPDHVSSPRGLPSYESVALFLQRAVAAVPTFELTDENQMAVAQICARLDGLPLPIELAAARLRVMSVQQIHDRLTDRYRLLTGGSRAAPARQKTLRWSIDWSYELCTPQEQRLWARLTVFACSFELDAAEAICGDGDRGGDLLDVVAALVDKSILIREEAGDVVRYRMLDILKEYGQEKLQPMDEYPNLRRRFQDWYQELIMRAATDSISPRQLHWLRRLEREQPNLRAALQFCLSESGGADAALRMTVGLFPFWFSRGYLREGRMWLDRVLAAADDESGADLAKAQYLVSVLAGVQGDVAEGAGLLARADSREDRPGDTSMRALRGFVQGLFALYNGDSVSAVAHFEESIGAAEETEEGAVFFHVGSLLGEGVAYMSLGDASEARARHEEMLALAGTLGDVVYCGRSAMIGAWAWWCDGDPSMARAVIEEGFRLSTRADDSFGIGCSLEVLAWIEADHNPGCAAVLLGAAAAIWRDVGGTMANYLAGLSYHSDCEQQARHGLGSRQFEEKYQHGSAFSVDEAVRYAFDEQPVPAKRSPEADTLSRRERQVAELVAEGLTNRAIAAKLVISQRTAQGHVENILSKLGYTSRTQIATWLVEHTHQQNPDPERRTHHS
ncbi:LuxR C-terminal-related transcriptional regulator [Rhodococcus wratislaviensis]|uniref:Putative LuxR family transcriptional regulator n=1 Tax=Rhodococcus wratislaviensis NBRC 100605 TaxID=1219028 RepID=X0RGM1_RHOWR|nr:LuxR C-terminal-related transcriptional regulator [Rhodococcus wratislaviensis]GAF50215.1 putative LuxR family transcriptional regulator [Rhodococcus wratislaviensis NBRC 100605]